MIIFILVVVVIVVVLSNKSDIYQRLLSNATLHLLQGAS